MKSMKQLLALVLALVLALGCAAMAEESVAPVVIKNGTRTFTLDYIPEKVLCTNMQLTEIMCMLGLEDRVMGTCYTNAEPYAPIADAFNAIPLFTQKYPDHESVVAAEPDMVLSTIWGLKETNCGTIEQLAEAGIPAYCSEGTLYNYEYIDQTYADILNIGIMFRVEDKAQALVAEMQEKIAAVQEKVAEIPEDERVTVFVADSFNDENLTYTAGTSMENELIKLAGGKNVCDDIGSTWAYVSAETMIAADPDYIIVNEYGVNYGSKTGAEKIEIIKGNEALAELDAVKNDRFYVIALQNVNESVRNADTVEMLAKLFYPELFAD